MENLLILRQVKKIKYQNDPNLAQLLAKQNIAQNISNLQFEYYYEYYNDANHEEDNDKQPIQETYKLNNFDLSVFENEVNNDDGILLIYNCFAQLDFFVSMLLC